MNASAQTGVFGKLPAHGDFIQRNLPASFVSVWDEWLQYFVAGSKEQLGDEWLNIYLTSPIWRFVFSHGVIDDNSWAGIMLPSVDRVGRYYPFSVVTKLPQRSNPLEFINLQNPWFEKVEELSLMALDGQVVIDDLTQALAELELNLNSDYVNSGQLTDMNSLQIDMEFEEQLPLSVYPYLLDSLLSKTFSSYSTWTTRGSERVEPCLFTVQRLPQLGGVSALLDGRWAEWGWQQPYRLNNRHQHG